tara:strand:+ start:130 stop:423 length:294 start_codon:yes stop_codon:yes gene_type:complete
MKNLEQHFNRTYHAIGRLWEYAHDGYQQYEIDECDCDLCEADSAARQQHAVLMQVDTNLRAIVLNLDNEHQNNPPGKIQMIIDQINRVRDRLTGEQQ